MFTFYKKQNNKLYNKLIELSRNKFFYKDLNLPDKFETRILLIFFHFALVLNIKIDPKNRKNKQDLFDNIFQNIEYHIRELGYGDVSVNKKMKELTKIFYDIVYNLEKKKLIIDDELLKKYFFKNENNIDNLNILADYFKEFYNFCFDLDVNIMLNGDIDFIHR